MVFAVIAVFFLSVTPAIISQNNDRGGWLLFMSSGSPTSAFDMWTTTTKSDVVEPYLYRASSEHLTSLENVNFRSELIDNLLQLHITEIVIGLFNSDGDIVHEFWMPMYGETTEAGWHTKWNISNKAKGQMFRDFSPSISIYSNDSNTNVAFLCFYSADHGAHFVYNTGYNKPFPTLPVPAESGCFEKPTQGYDPYVYTVMQCQFFCNTVGYPVYGIYTTDKHYCTCMDTKPLASLNSNIYCSSLCSDDKPCGGSVAMTVYKMELFTTLMDSLVGNKNNTAQELYKMNSTYTYINLGGRKYVTRLETTSLIPEMNFTIGNRMVDCEAPEDSMPFDYHVESSGNIIIYHTNAVYNIEPTPVWCLHFNFTEPHLITIPVIAKFDIVQSDFLEAAYMGLYGHWDNVECTNQEVLDSATFIEDANIQITYQPEPYAIGESLSTNAFTFDVPETAVGKIIINLPDTSTEFWVQNITVMTTVDVKLQTTITTSRKCRNAADDANIYTSLSYQSTNNLVANVAKANEFSGLKASGSNIFCGDKIELWAKTTKAKYQTNQMFGFQVYVYGCTNRATCTVTNLLDSYLYDHVYGRWNMNDHVTQPALRPHGVGLVLDTTKESSIQIKLSDYADLEVHSVSVIGNKVISIHCIVGDYDNIVFGKSRVEIPVNGERSSEVVLKEITGTDDLVTLTIEIQVCVLGNITTLTTTTLAPTAATSSPPTQVTSTETTSTQTSTSTTTVSPTSTLSPNTATSATTTVGISTETTSTQMSTSTMTVTSTVQPTLPTVNVPTIPTNPPTAPPTTQTIPQTPPSVPTMHSSGSSPTTTRTPQAPPACNCNCIQGTSNRTENITTEELDAIVEELVKNLTIPKRKTSAFKRSKISVSDDRGSSTAIGTAGVVVLVFVGILIVVADITFIAAVVNFIASTVKGLLTVRAVN